MSTTMHAGLKRVGRGAATGLLASLAALFVAGPSFADIHLPTAWAQGDTEASSIYSLDTVLSVPDAEEDVAGIHLMGHRNEATLAQVIVEAGLRSLPGRPPESAS